MSRALRRDPIYRHRRFSSEIIETCVRWYITYRLSYRDLSEMMAERAPGAAQAPCLVLSSENRYHRVWSYPVDWMRRTIDELLPAPKPKPSAGT